MKNIPGVVTAIVKSLDDRSGEGKIELVFPWLHETQRSAWAPIAVPLAGKSRGMFFMPEINDEVLVAFDRGDFDHPFIVGHLWNGVDKPPETSNQNRVILTPGGHTLRFEDGAGDKRIVIKTSGGHEIKLDDAGKHITVKTAGGDTSITLDDVTHSLELKGGGRSLRMAAGAVMIT